MSIKDRGLWLYDALRLPGFITSVYLETSGRCQLACKTCYRGNRELGLMDQKTFCEAYQQIRNVPTVRDIYFHVAGEPTLNPALADYIDWFANDHYNLVLSTNGMLPVNDLADKVDMVSFSLGGIGEIHEANRRGSHWSIVLKNIMDLVDTPRKRTKIGVSLVRTAETDEEINQFLDFWEGVDHITISQYHTPGLKVAGCNRPGMGQCRYLRHTATVLWNGDLTTCCSDLQGLNVYGNIHKMKLKDIRFMPGHLCAGCDIWIVQ